MGRKPKFKSAMTSNATLLPLLQQRLLLNRFLCQQLGFKDSFVCYLIAPLRPS
jgi:hypothetical protein